ncbi:MAG TPA: SDR family NAD(P)-dependent oxidoreductase [Oligoflexia bacterium]|nr:SDR family NAD(P)-dependent oxidoreductase [Oligoflexia bacterium]
MNNSRWVFITGASSGIGRACAELAFKKGYSVFATARRQTNLETLKRSLKKGRKNRFEFAKLDVRSAKEVESFAKKHRELLSKTQILINNAGLARGLDSFAEPLAGDWTEKVNAMIDTNVKGLLWVTRALLPHLIKNRGHIVNIGSIAGQWVYPRGNVYCASKFAVRALNEALRQDLLGTGVRVTEVAPGMVETEFSLVRLGDAQSAKNVYRGMHPLTAADIAESVVWCIGRPKHVNVQSLTLYPIDQASPTLVHRHT